ncbi:PREDICTED: uncharacterized protein LOC108775982, partial [Cyphomyrmex costatus]|uniref:uncharacterized protein LOC108775982 n=1 Tax=Cyphomyrmex costatus TaxID=456900 RepID=UPI0008523EF9
MRFPKLLLNIGLILITRTVSCMDNNVEIIDRFLPNNSVPIHYNVKLTPHLEEGNFTFYGESNITIEIRYELSNITLHSWELEINETATTLINDYGTVYKPVKHIQIITSDILVLSFNDVLSPGLYILNMKFAGNLLDSSQKQGFMKFSYLSPKGNTRWLAVTHFGPNGARRMFPCWDEPAIKATFSISVTHHEKYSVLSNMPIREQHNEQENMIWTHFETTPVMSTYIVAIAMSEFVRGPNANGTINMWYRSITLTSKVKFGHSTADKIVKFLNRYTTSSQKVPKMDHVLIPNFVVDGMENWGLITYDESNIIYDDDRDPMLKKIEIALLIAHELAHQWFGNLVTPYWWNYQWLSEGFASFFQMYIINKIFKDWRTTEIFMFHEIQQCFLKDTEFSNSVIMKYGINFEDDSLNSYVNKKASVLLRMLQNIITDEVFRNGVIIFLTKHQFHSVTPDDLWSAMQSALNQSDIPHEDYKIKEVMDTWMNQESYPFVHVERNYETGEVTISKICVKQFEEISCANKWWIPITFATQSNPDFSNTVPRYWLRPDQHNISFTIDPNDWIIVNLQLTGYYRVSYDNENWQKIANYLNSKEYENIHVLNRAQIVIDSFILIFDDRISALLFLQLSGYLSKERDYVAWQSLFEVIEHIPKTLLLPEMRHFKIHIQQFLDWLLRNVKYVEDPNDNDVTKLIRINALKWACVVDNEECKNMTVHKLSRHLANPKTYTISRWEKYVYCTGMMTANKTTWDKMFELYVKGELKHHDRELLKGLSCARDPDIIINYLNILALNTSLFNNDKHSLVFKYILEQHVRNDIILDYVLENLKIIKPRLLTTLAVIKLILENIYSLEQIDKIFALRTIHLLEIEDIQQCLFQDTIGSLSSVTLKLGNSLDKLSSKYSTEIYKKSFVLLRMLQNIITYEVFRNGLIIYLDRHQYSSVTPDDLWSAMQSALNKSNIPHDDYKIKDVMDTWMNQERYPFVHVERNYETGEVTISQIRARQFGETENKTTKWWIPITFATQSNPEFSNTVPYCWLQPDEQSISFIINPDDWIIVNLQYTGYYRVSYDTRNWQKIAQFLNTMEYNNIHVLNRAQIIADSHAMVLDDRLEGHLHLLLTGYLKRDNNYVAWQPLFHIIETMQMPLLLPEMMHVKNYYSYLLHELFKHISYVEDPDDGDVTKLTRLIAMKCACDLGIEECKKVTALKLSKHIMDPNTYKLRRGEKFLYCTGMIAANRTTWDRMFELCLNGELTEQENRLWLKGLSCAEDPDIIINYLKILASNISLFRDDVHSDVFRNILKRHVCNNKIFKYILNNFEMIKPRSLSTPTLIKLILDNVNSFNQIDKVEKFSQTNFNENSNTLSEIKKLIAYSKEYLRKVTANVKRQFKNYIFKLRTQHLLQIQDIQRCLLQDTVGSLNSVTLKFDNTLDQFLSLYSVEIYKKCKISQFNSVTPDDLWNAMQSALNESDIPHEDYKIKEVMDTWMNQERYPFVHVERNYETGEVTISQIRARQFEEPENKTTKWWIPITFATQSNPEFSNTVPHYWLQPDQHNISFKINPNDWIIVNLQLTGYYRVSYDIRNWQKISNFLNTNEYSNIHVLNRAQIIADSHAMVLDDRLEGHLHLLLISYLRRDRNYVAWQPLLDIIETMPTPLLLPEMNHVKKQYKYLLHNLLRHMNYVENPDDDDITKQIRLTAIKCACNLGIKKCKKMTALKLSKHIADPNTYKLRRGERFLYCTGMIAANRTVWDRMFELYLNGKLTQQENRLLKGLSCAEDPDIIIKSLNAPAMIKLILENVYFFKHI